MTKLLKKIFLKWITPALSPMWTLVVGVFGVLVIAVKLLANSLKKEKNKNEKLESEVQRAERIQNVEINSNRTDALERLRRDGKVRQD